MSRKRPTPAPTDVPPDQIRNVHTAAPRTYGRAGAAPGPLGLPIDWPTSLAARLPRPRGLEAGT